MKIIKYWYSPYAGQKGLEDIRAKSKNKAREAVYSSDDPEGYPIPVMIVIKYHNLMELVVQFADGNKAEQEIKRVYVPVSPSLTSTRRSAF